MPYTLTIKTSGVAVLGEEQAKHCALSIFADVKAYIKEHGAEYEQCLACLLYHNRGRAAESGLSQESIKLWTVTLQGNNDQGCTGQVFHNAK